MATTTEITAEMQALKTRLKATWEAGDYGIFAKYLEPGALEFFERINIQPGSRLLDVACGAGQLTVPAAKTGIDVTGLDLAQNLVDQANERLQQEGLKAKAVQGDAEDLPFADNEFDVTLSLIGAMFAPRPELVAKELLRVTKPGGTVVMGNWTPEGHVGQMFKVIGKHVPPPPIFPSPLQWGNREKLHERLGPGTSDLRVTSYLYPMKYPFPPAKVVDFFVEFYGPTNKAYNSLQGEAKDAFMQDFIEVWERNNTATDGTTLVMSEYLEVVGTKKA